MRRPRSFVSALAVIALVGLESMIGIPTADAVVPRLSIVEQDFNLEPDDTLHLTVALPAGLDPSTVAAATIAVTSYRAVESRARIDEVLDGAPGQRIDSVQLTSEAASLGLDRTWRLEVPTETTTRARAALRFPDTALYPVGVRVEVDGEPVAEVVTFVHRLPAPDPDGIVIAPMRVAVVASLHHPVELDDSGTVTHPDAAIPDVIELASLLADSAVPVSAGVEPALIAAMAADRSDSGSGRAVGRLSIALSGHELLSDTSLPLDPSAAAAADRSDLYTDWLRDGEDLLAATLSTAPSRSTVLVDAPLSAGGGTLLRDLGARLLVLPRAEYDTLPGSISGYTDPTRLVQVDVGSGLTVDATVVDHSALARLDSVATGAPAPVVAVAELLAARQEVIERGEDPGRHGITLGLTDLGVPAAEGFGDFTALLAATPGLEPTTIDELAVRTEVQQVEGRPVVVSLPPTVAADITGRVDTVDALTRTGRATASMLPDRDPRPAGWERLTSILPSSAVTDAQVTTIAGNLDDQFATVLRSVQVPAGFGFNLTGRSGTVPVSLFNSADIPLEVTVQMSSSKLTFPEGPRTVVLEPGVYTEVRIAITARSNGRIPATLLVTTPEGRLPLAPAVPITATVNAIDGLGNLVTGAALLVLLTWWGRNMRRSRRQRLAAEAAECAARHPVHGDRPDDTSVAAPHDTAADAPTTTLPPS